MKGRLGLFLFTFIFLLITTACWDRREPQYLIINTALGIDLLEENGQKKFVLSFLIPRHTKTGNLFGAQNIGQEQSPNKVMSSQGETIDEAYRTVFTRSSRQLFLGNTLVVVIGEKMAQDGIKEMVDFLARSKDFRFHAWVLVSEGTALEALQTQPEIEDQTAFEINGLISHTRKYASLSPQTNLLNLYQALVNPGRQPLLPRLKIITPPEKDPVFTQHLNVETSPESQESDNKTSINRIFTVDGAAAFKGDKLVGWLEGEETQGILFLRNEEDMIVLSVVWEGDKKITVVMQQICTQVEPEFTGDGIIFRARIEGKGRISEQQTGSFQWLSQEDYRQLQDKVAAEIQERCLRGLEKSQSLGTDVINLGEVVRINNPGLWRQLESQWDHLFPTVRLEFDKMDIKITDTGVIREPYEAKNR